MSNYYKVFFTITFDYAEKENKVITKFFKSDLHDCECCDMNVFAALESAEISDRDLEAAIIEGWLGQNDSDINSHDAKKFSNDRTAIGQSSSSEEYSRAVGRFRNPGSGAGAGAGSAATSSLTGAPDIASFVW